MKNIKFSLILSFLALSVVSMFGQSKTTLLYNGSSASKFDIVFIGDGFTGAQQAEYNTLVANYFKAMFTHDNGGLDNVLSELQDAFNVYRINFNSASSGVTSYKCGESGCPNTSNTNKNTAYGFRYSGCWDCCWIGKSGNTDTKINNALSSVGLAGAEYVVAIINRTGFGGCSYGKVLTITKSTSNNVLLHELGHSVGKLADEYERPGCYTGAEPSARNVSKFTNPAKWSLFAKAGNTTGAPTEYNVAGYEGARYKDCDMYRPSSNSTMRGNTNLFNPPSYDEFWQQNKSKSNYDFDKVIVGNFGGNSYSDVVVHYGNHISAYLVGTPPGFTGSGVSTRVTNSYLTTKKISGPGGTWWVGSTDRFHAGDFTGDGKDDLLVFRPNGSYSILGLLKSVPGGFETQKIFYYNLPGFAMRSGDKFYIADFNGDGKKDFFIYNATNWSMGYVGMYRSTGSGFSYTRRYDDFMAGHKITSSDKYYVADIDGNNKEELVVFRTSTLTTRMFKSNGNSLSISASYYGSMPGWTNKANDKFLIADYNGDNKDDLYVFNGKDWGPEYLLMLRSNGNSYSYTKRYDGNLPGWDMQNDDRYYVADINGDGKEDLYVYNSANWSTQYLGRVISNSTTVSASWQDDWVGGWNLGSSDKLIVDDRSSGRDNLFIHNKNWFGYMWSGTSNMYLKAIYKDYIHTFKHHDWGWY